MNGAPISKATTYGQVQAGDAIEGEVVTNVEHFAGGQWSFTRITVGSGGQRTEASDFPALVTPTDFPVDPLLVAVSNKDLQAGADVFADHLRDRVVPRADALPALHGVALELNRRWTIAREWTR